MQLTTNIIQLSMTNFVATVPNVSRCSEKIFSFRLDWMIEEIDQDEKFLDFLIDEVVGGAINPYL